MFQRSSYQDLTYYEFSDLKEFPLRHAVFTRFGGVSKGPYSSLNLSFEVGDDSQAVYENRYRIKQALGVSRLVSAKQVHGKRYFLCSSPLKRDIEIEGCDLILTDQQGVGVLIKQADCQAFMLYDERQHSLALGHAGWRGLVAGILEEAVELMQSCFGSKVEDLWAAVFPSLGPCCAEFRGYKELFPPSFWPFQIKPNYFDLWSLSVHKLRAKGLNPARILTSDLCNKCHREFYSYRREKVTGRFGSVAVLC